MTYDTNLAELRRDLDELTRGDPTPEAIAKLLARSSRLVLVADGEEDSTCAPYALGLDQVDSYWETFDDTGGDVRAGKVFMTDLLATKRLQPLAALQPSCLVVYWAGEQWTHIGIGLEGGRVRSKWALWPVFEHELMEVPAQYGDRVSFYAAISVQDATSHFEDFARLIKLAIEQGPRPA